MNNRTITSLHDSGHVVIHVIIQKGKKIYLEVSTTDPWQKQQI